MIKAPVLDGFSRRTVIIRPLSSQTGSAGKTFMATRSLLDIAMIIVSVALVASIVLQSKEAGLGGIGGAEVSNTFSTRRGLERTLFRVTVILSFVFFLLAIYTVYISG